MNHLPWLLENGGPAIKLRMMHESLIEKNLFDAEHLTGELLQIESIRQQLGYFDAFKDYKMMGDHALFALVHNGYDNCYEQFMPRLIQTAGLQAGIPAFDCKVSPMRAVYQYLVDTDWSHIYGLIIILHMLRAGYFYEDMFDYLNIRVINPIHQTATRQAFDIYENDPSKIRQPHRWQGKLILKDIHNCEIGALPMPTGYHVGGILNLYKYVENPEIKAKIDDITAYLLHPEYQKLHGDYGWHWSGKTYHASSAGIDLPLFDHLTLTTHQQWNFLYYVELMSQSPTARSSIWLQKCTDYLEDYKTERETYLFPEELLYSTLMHKTNKPALYQALISKDSLSKLNRNKQKIFMMEVYSTFYMAMLHNRLLNP